VRSKAVSYTAILRNLAHSAS